MKRNGKSEKRLIRKKSKKQKMPVSLAVALIGLLGTILVAVATYISATLPLKITISLTQTTEARATLSKAIEIANYTKTPISTPSQLTTLIPTVFVNDLNNTQIKVTLSGFNGGDEIGGIIRFAPEIRSPAELKQLDIYINDQVLTSINSPPYEYLFDSTSFSPGTYEFTFIVININENYGSIKISLKIVEPIVIRIIAPQEGNDIQETNKIIAEVSSISGIAKVNFAVDGIQIASFNTPPYETTWNFDDLAKGLHTIMVTSYDLNGIVDQETVIVQISGASNSWILLPLICLSLTVILFIFIAKKKYTVGHNGNKNV